MGAKLGPSLVKTGMGNQHFVINLIMEDNVLAVEVHFFTNLCLIRLCGASIDAVDIKHSRVSGTRAPVEEGYNTNTISPNKTSSMIC